MIKKAFVLLVIVGGIAEGFASGGAGDDLSEHQERQKLNQKCKKVIRELVDSGLLNGHYDEESGRDWRVPCSGEWAAPSNWSSGLSANDSDVAVFDPDLAQPIDIAGLVKFPQATSFAQHDGNIKLVLSNGREISLEAPLGTPVTQQEDGVELILPKLLPENPK